MTIEMRGRGLPTVIALAVPLAVVALGVAAWVDAGRQPVREIVVSVAVPESSR
ncbi:hypothetical protein [Novosphingobium mangrovi (ex Huang et al. 2023)]|uniref:Uncharacterized protein n=1 Tax=Novosphingobium mangrovi (ex Huang et al. 2023) TaxID=2976432 RepID=A0ABT2I844_9SPHN|nr:hypothetical protein [Novosphingobium mangrovi (ex Huang et al. 2023)]MCT2400991.1 hypothetical protein [Novosphingobium mangrovi (ex Huang et al. 2023)]